MGVEYNPVHDLLGATTELKDGIYQLDEFGFTIVRASLGRIIETRAPGRPMPLDRTPSPRVQEMLDQMLPRIAELKQNSSTNI